jgi:hypothetical protein
MIIRVDEHWRVRALSSIELPLPAAAVWGQMRHFEHFLTADPLHARITVEQLGPDAATPRGAVLRISHRLLGIGPDRTGRIVRWREGKELAFSDLSRRGRDIGFPHICGYRLEATGPERSRLTSYAIGRWTATWMPRWLVRAWLWWVLRATEAALLHEFAKLRKWREGRLGHAAR